MPKYSMLYVFLCCGMLHGKSRRSLELRVLLLWQGVGWLDRRQGHGDDISWGIPCDAWPLWRPSHWRHSWAVQPAAESDRRV